ncbi:MAG: CAP domain-containing protein [Myxococcota bacterium]
MDARVFRAVCLGFVTFVTSCSGVSPSPSVPTEGGSDAASTASPSDGGQPDARRAPDGGSAADAASSSVCVDMCAHVYDDCGFSFRADNGQPVTEAQCVQACENGEFNGGEACILAATCNTAVMGACIPQEQPDAGSGVDAGNDPGDWPAAWAALEQQVLDEVNVRRAQGATCGGQAYDAVDPLTMHPALQAAARGHSKDMADNDYFDHTSQDGRSPFDRTAEAGYNGGFTQGENIAAGNDTAAATVEQWMSSPGHCRNIMNGAFRHLGVGYAYGPSSTYGHYWTQNFGG